MEYNVEDSEAGAKYGSCK